MPVLRSLIAFAFLACCWLALGFPAVGMLLAVAPPPPAPISRMVVMEGERSTLGRCRRERVGALWYLHLEGDPAQIGYAKGALAGDLDTVLEGEMMRIFIQIIPNFFSRHLILGAVCFLNRDLADHFHGDELSEIAACVAGNDEHHDTYRSSIPHGVRALQYHALHDVSHYLIDNPLVRTPQIGCTALAVGRSRAQGGHLLVGRLFDFEGGREFDIDKVVETVRPKQGLAFVSVSWAGVSGVVTGMNEAGLWASINAGSSRGQRYSGRPVLMAVREILEHCRTLAQAEAVLRDTQVFVSEAIMLASAGDGRAEIAEIGPTGLELRAMDGDTLVAANHFEAGGWSSDPVNQQRMLAGTSVKRAARARELLAGLPAPGVDDLLAILRDRRGPGGKDVGFGNRGTINAWIGAHLAVADLDRGVMWVCEAPHGLGRARAFSVDGPVDVPPLRASEDLPLYACCAAHVRDLAAKAHAALDAGDLAGAASAAGEWIGLDPASFEAQWLAGMASNQPALRREHLRRALDLEPAYPRDRTAIEHALAEVRGE